MAILIRILLLFSCSVKILHGCRGKSSVKITPPPTATTTTTTLPTTPAYLPVFLTETQHIQVLEGEVIKLACDVENLGTQIISWAKGNYTIPHDEPDDRIKVENTENGSTVVIKEATEIDGGEYVCTVSAVELVHTVEIILRPEVEPVPKSGLITVKEGESATIACNITRGGPGTSMKWEKDAEITAQPELAYPLFWFEDSVTITKVERWNAGLIRCKADNGWPEPATAEIRLVVHYEPDVQISTLTSGKFHGTELTPFCVVRSVPNATVEWYKDGVKLDGKNTVEGYSGYSDKFMHNYGPITGMGQGWHPDKNWALDTDKLGIYECRAKNYLGEASAKIAIVSRCDTKNCWKRVKNEN